MYLMLLGEAEEKKKKFYAHLSRKYKSTCEFFVTRFTLSMNMRCGLGWIEKRTCAAQMHDIDARTRFRSPTITFPNLPLAQTRARASGEEKGRRVARCNFM
ncbi:hypothetical protein PUN28_001781 [Cardiocondyla obscurior]|uniref:Uncharacterized protein n=1 Tax=Cardiocondyla obscurior TaxID=286306 RepID=A0AAW2GRB1_9HYME